MDHADYRKRSRENWGRAASAWSERSEEMERITMPVSAWLVDAVEPQPGFTLLELAAGTGDVGFMAYELIQPGGTLITSDFAPEMLSAAQERAQARGLTDIRFKQIDAESIDLGAGSLDAVICRFGFMLMADPGAALRECRRVLRAGGRLAFAAWSSPQDNPWTRVLGAELVRRGYLPPPDPDAPGQFAWAPPGTAERFLDEAGFVEHHVEELRFAYAFPSFDAWWEAVTSLGRMAADALAALDAAEYDSVREAVRASTEPFATPDGGLDLPAATWVGWAEA